MKKQILFAIMLIFMFFTLSAQRSRDVVYLKNGSMIFGKLIEVNSEHYKIQTSDGSILIYSVAEVEKYARQAPFYDGRKERGFSSAMEAGLLAGAQHSEYFAPFSFNFLVGITTGTKHTTSIGSGVEFFGRPYTPVFIEYKYLINSNKTCPFIFFRGGGVLPLDREEATVYDGNYQGPKNYRGGASMTMGTGISWAKEDYETYLSFAYRYAHTSYMQNEYNHGDVKYVNSMNRLEIKFGFKF